VQTGCGAHTTSCTMGTGDRAARAWSWPLTSIQCFQLCWYTLYCIWSLNCGCIRLFICLFACSARTDRPICTKLGMLIPWDQEDILEESKLLKSVLSSSPGEGSSCSLESKHDRITAPKQTLFVLAGMLQEQRPQSQKTILVSSLGEDGFRDNIFYMIFSDT
jgi:hypothetical protein